MEELNHIFVSSSIQVQSDCGLMSLHISHNEDGSLTNKAEELLLHTLKEFDGTCEHFVFPVVVDHGDYRYTHIRVEFMSRRRLSITPDCGWYRGHRWEVVVDKQEFINSLEKLLTVGVSHNYYAKY